MRLLSFAALCFSAPLFQAYADKPPAYKPVVLWHGMGDSCCNPESMGKIKSTIEQLLPGTYVYSVRIGDTDKDDQNSGFFGNLNQQVDQVCQQLRENKKLRDGFNAVGFSQGGLFLRAYVQRCNHPPIHNLITFGSPHVGASDIPGCADPADTSCRLMRSVVRRGAYASYVRDHVIQAQYFKDPDNIETYLANNIFLPDINNELAVNKTYARRLSSLHHLVLIRFTEDVTLKPAESSWFWFYDEFGDLLPLEEQPLWTDDLLGLRRLAERGTKKDPRLIFEECPGQHMQIPMDYFEDQILWPYLAEEESKKKHDQVDAARRAQVVVIGGMKEKGKLVVQRW